MNEWHNMTLRSQNNSFKIWSTKVLIDLKFIYNKIKLGKEKKKQTKWIDKSNRWYIIPNKVIWFKQFVVILKEID